MLHDVLPHLILHTQKKVIKKNILVYVMEEEFRTRLTFMNPISRGDFYLHCFIPEFCFLECPVLVPAILWSLSRDRGSVERVLAGCPSDSDSEQASSFAMVLRVGLWERRGGMCQGRIHGGANEWCRPSAGPCAMRKSSKPGEDSAFG